MWAHLAKLVSTSELKVGVCSNQSGGAKNAQKTEGQKFGRAHLGYGEVDSGLKNSKKKKRVWGEGMQVALWAWMLSERHQCQMFAGRTLPGVSGSKNGKEARKGQQPPLPRRSKRRERTKKGRWGKECLFASLGRPWLYGRSPSHPHWIESVIVGVVTM